MLLLKLIDLLLKTDDNINCSRGWLVLNIIALNSKGNYQLKWASYQTAKQFLLTPPFDDDEHYFCLVGQFFCCCWFDVGILIYLLGSVSFAAFLSLSLSLTFSFCLFHRSRTKELRTLFTGYVCVCVYLYVLVCYSLFVSCFTHTQTHSHTKKTRHTRMIHTTASVRLGWDSI